MAEDGSTSTSEISELQKALNLSSLLMYGQSESDEGGRIATASPVRLDGTI